MAATVIGVAEIKLKCYPVNDKTSATNRPPYEKSVRTSKFTIKASNETDLEDWQDRVDTIRGWMGILLSW